MSDTSERPGLRLLIFCWLLIAAAFMVRAHLNAAVQPLILDTDDAMRLTVVHDFLNGQGWYDLVQHRLNTPFGAEIHWSRLIDLPEAMLLYVLRLVAPASADIVAAYAWPLALLFILLALSGRIATRLGGAGAALPAMLLPAFSLITMAEFAPGRFDHHSAQIILAFLMLYCTMRAQDRPRFAILAGIGAAAALAIGIEGLPVAGATAIAFGLAWVASLRQAKAMRVFGLSFALASVVALAIGLPPERWFIPAFDAISIVYVGAAILCGLVFLILSGLPFRHWQGRLVLGIIGGGLVAGVTLWLYPGLRAGPYGMLDPWLITNWIDRIAEAQPWWISLVGDPTYPVAVAVPPLVALIVIVWHALRGPVEQRGAWWVYAVILVAAIAVMLLQIRAARFATPLAVPACAVLIAEARQRYLARRKVLPILGLVGAWLISAGIVVAVGVNLTLLAFPDYAEATEDTQRENRQACLMPSAFDTLAQLPAQRIMAPIDMGSHLLLWTPHSVVAAPYHRGQQGVLDAFSFFNKPIAEAREILRARGISLVVICPAMPEVRGMVDYAPDSFVALYAEDKLPDWLTPADLGKSPLKAFAVTP